MCFFILECILSDWAKEVENIVYIYHGIQVDFVYIEFSIIIIIIR